MFNEAGKSRPFIELARNFASPFITKEEVNLNFPSLTLEEDMPSVTTEKTNNTGSSTIEEAKTNPPKASCLEGCNKWKVAAIVAGVLLIISIIAVVALSLPFTAPAIAAIGIAGTSPRRNKSGSSCSHLCFLAAHCRLCRYGETASRAAAHDGLKDLLLELTRLRASSLFTTRSIKSSKETHNLS